jgi:hypothetical protein
LKLSSLSMPKIVFPAEIPGWSWVSESENKINSCQSSNTEGKKCSLGPWAFP